MTSNYEQALKDIRELILVNGVAAPVAQWIAERIEQAL